MFASKTLTSCISMPWYSKLKQPGAAAVTNKWNTFKNSCENSSTLEDIMQCIQCADKGNLVQVLSERPVQKQWDIMRKIQLCALDLHKLFGSKGIEALKSGESKRVSFTAEEVACVIANGVFCTFDKQCNNYQHFSFEGILGQPSEVKLSKLRCILYYFEKYFEEAELESSLVKPPSGNDDKAKVAEEPVIANSSSIPEWRSKSRKIVVERRVLDYDIDWQQRSASVQPIRIESVRRIEDVSAEAEDGEAWYADFADPFLGGRFFNFGCLQEEIRFAITPELLISALVCEKMTEREAVVVHGVRRFADYSGYAKSFRALRLKERSIGSANVTGSNSASSSRDTRPTVGTRNVEPADTSRFLPHTVFAVDALNMGGRFRSQGRQFGQFDEAQIRRELDKFFTGTCRVTQKKNCELQCVIDHVGVTGTVTSLTTDSESGAGAATSSVKQCTIVSGNWGCGAFGGDRHLKTLVQLMSACLSGRTLTYCTMGDKGFAQELERLNEALKLRKPTVGELYELLLSYGASSRSGSIFDFVTNALRTTKVHRHDVLKKPRL